MAVNTCPEGSASFCPSGPEPRKIRFTSWPTRASSAGNCGAANPGWSPVTALAALMLSALSKEDRALWMGSIEGQTWKCLRRIPAMSWRGATWSTQPRSKAALGMP